MANTLKDPFRASAGMMGIFAGEGGGPVRSGGGLVAGAAAAALATNAVVNKPTSPAPSLGARIAGVPLGVVAVAIALVVIVVAVLWRR
jgi:hypothetical protein